MKLSTINLLVEGVLETAQKRYEAILKDGGVVVKKVRKERAKKVGRGGSKHSLYRAKSR